MITNHFYSRYGLALLLEENSIADITEYKKELFLPLMLAGMSHFRFRPIESTHNGNKIEYEYAKSSFLEQNPRYIKSHCNEGYFLSQSVITIDKESGKCWNAIQSLVYDLNNGNFKQHKATMSIMPLTSKINNGKLSQLPPNISFWEACFCTITTTTPYKPSLLEIVKGKNGINYVPSAIIPDLEISNMIKFISLFKEIQRTQTQGLMTGTVEIDEKQNTI